MGPYKVFIESSAKLDIQEARAYYRSISLSLVKKLNSEIDEVISKIIKAPLAYGVRSDGNRRYNLKNFSFALFYYVTEVTRTIHVIAFVHTSRNYSPPPEGSAI